MAAPLEAPLLRAFLLDIEGTTTPAEFVYDVLFPYARARVKEFFLQHRTPDVLADIETLRSEYAADIQRGLQPLRWRSDSPASEIESIVAYVHWLMHQDRKSTGLKSIQGKIWKMGYVTGELRGQVYPDVPVAFKRWHAQKRDISIFSSGSVLAQKLLFAHSEAGDLTKFIRAYFDTHTGTKTEAESYRRIALALQMPPSTVAFVSDVPAELDAAQAAQMQTVLCMRPGRPHPDASPHPVIHSFDEICP